MSLKKSNINPNKPPLLTKGKSCREFLPTTFFIQAIINASLARQSACFYTFFPNPIN